MSQGEPPPLSSSSWKRELEDARPSSSSKREERGRTGLGVAATGDPSLGEEPNRDIAAAAVCSGR
jgi:hypothetical protein